MKRIAVAMSLALALSACVVSHLKKEIQPPGGCDQCHRATIAGSWEVSVAPVTLGREGGVPDAADLILRDLRAVPYHSAVPEKKLAVYAAGVPAEALGAEETGIQCFLCHRSPGPPHEKARGHHPWGRPQEAR